MIELGKYATTVLSAYGISLVLLIGIVALTWHRNNAVRRKLNDLERNSDG